MDLMGQSTSVNSTLCSGSRSGLSRDRIKDLLSNLVTLKQPKVPLSSELSYLTPLWVSKKEDLQKELYQYDSFESTITCFEPQAENIVPRHQKISEKIRATLNFLTFRNEHVLVQFWSVCDVGKHQLLTTVDQPFGVGIANEKLCLYRRASERNAIFVDRDDEEEDVSPPARVFRQGLPEWTSDLSNYKPENFPQQACALSCNFHGYLALPVFDSTTSLCVGVLELLTSSKYTGYAFEVQQIYKVLKTQILTCPQVHDSATPKVPNERRQNELDKICYILKIVCDIHNLPLAQTWAVSPSSCFVSHDKIIDKSCDSFDIKCIGKVCMSTAALPFYVRNLSVWPFREACKEQHLDKYRSFLGRALLARGSSYCQDVTELSEEEYPLVHNARMSGLTSCFTVYLHTVEGDDDYVIEFYLQLDGKDGRHVLNLLQTLKQKIEVASGFELGEISPIELTGPPQNIQISSITTANTLVFGVDSSDPVYFLADVAKTDSANVPSQCLSKENSPNKQGDIITNSEMLVWNDVVSDNINEVGSRKNDNAISAIVVNEVTVPDAGEKSNSSKRGRKRKIDLITMEAVEKHVGKPIGQVAKSVGVSRSTLKRFCRENGISSWPMPKHSKKTSYVTDPKLSSSPCLDMGVVALVVIDVKRWSCSSKHHGFSGKWWCCGKHSYLPSKSDSICQVEGQLMVKATLEDNTIKFPFHIFMGLLELENEVAKRLRLKGKRFSLKYKDEDNDLVSIICDADLHFLSELLASNTTLRLLVELVVKDKIR